MSHRIAFIGAGNLATHLAPEFKRVGYDVVQVFSRTRDSAEALASLVDCSYTTVPEEISSEADLLFVALSDAAFHEVLPRVKTGNRLLVHGSGSMPLNSLERYSENTGVFYPLQTFSKNHPVDFKIIPLFVEAKKKSNEDILTRMAETLSDKVMVLDSETRLYLHIAAVFACNFVNHLYARASEVLEIRKIPFEMIRPLILETAMKVQAALPYDVQTGPAVRFDRHVIDAHLDALQEYPGLQNIYQLVSESLFNYHKIK